jgi:hypothetical protein
MHIKKCNYPLPVLKFSEVSTPVSNQGWGSFTLSPPERPIYRRKGGGPLMKTLQTVLLLVLAVGAMAAEKTVYLEDFDASW